MSKIVAVSGASGHIGNVVCRKLIELGYAVKAFYHSDAASLQDLQLTLVKGDILDPTAVRNLLSGCDYVINCAAIISINGDPSGIVYKTNTQGPENILSVAKEHGIKKIIHVSSVHAVHDLPHNTPYDETRPYKTKSDFAYDYSKAQGEQIMLSGAETNGLEVVVVRPSCVIGPHDFKPSKMGVALRGFYKKKFLFLPNGGYDLVDVRDLSTSICAAIELGKNKEIYLLSGKYYSFKELGKEIGKVRAFDMKVGLTKLADGEYAVVSSKRTKDINGMDIIPNWYNPPYNTIMADFFNQAGYPAGEGCYTWDSLPNMLNGVWNTDTYIAKFNANLSLLWETQFDSDDKAPVNHPGDFKKQECMYRIAEGADGSLVAVGNSSHNIDDYLFVKVFSDCQSLANYEIKDIADNTITIVGNQTWNTNSTLIGKVVIPNGQSLTISNSTIQFADSRRVTIDTRIVIEPGGKLIINNATLTSLQSCENAMWDGIEIQGNPTMSQIPNSNQGYLSVVNSIISNSRNAVSTVARDTNFSINWSNTGGGIVKASNSQFINNYRTFEFMKYHPLNTAGNPTIDLSSISSCLFSTNDTFGDGGTIINPYAQITMWDTRNIRVSGNIFENLRLNISEINRGIGIVAIDAAFAIKPGCNAPIISASGCLEVNQIKNEFHNLYTGISTSGVTSASFTIDNALFTNNLYGIRIEGAQFGEIIRSTFNVPFSAVPGETKYGFGIYADAASAIKIEGNVFDGLYNTTGRSIGVFMNNSDVIGGGVSNYRNDYLNLSIGTQVAGSNTTLEIDCNRFYKQTSVSFADIHVATGILANQGVCNTPINPDPTLPQANEFYGLCNNTSFNQLRNTSSASFEYNSYPQADVGFDTSCLNGNILGMACQTSITYARDSACPSTITTIGGSVDKLVKIEEDKSQITFLQNKVDGGNSLEIQQLIANSIDANNLKSQLDSIEPYLSQQNQLAVINKNMPGVIKKQILEDNAAFKPDVCNGIVNSTMSNAVKNQLMAIAYGESPLDRLDKLIHHYENELRLASNDLMKVYLDSNYMDSTSFALSERISIERTKLMIPILVQKDSVSALNYLSLVQNYADSILLTQPEEAQELVRFHDFYSNILTIVNRPSGYFNLSTIELQTIKDIANEIGPMASHANSILNFIDKKLPYVDAYDLNGTKSTKVYTEQEKWIPLPEELPKITVFPNPSTGIFEIRFEEKNNTLTSVEVYNLEGRLLFEENALTKNMNIDLSNLNSGIFILKVQTFLNESEVYYTERIVISN